MVSRVLVLLAVCGCRVTGVFECLTSDQCRENGTTGTCEPTGYCSFIDGTCASGRRYDDTAEPEVAGTCVLGAWMNVQLVDLSTASVQGPTLTADMLELYVYTGGDIYVTTRASVGDAWAPVVKVAELSPATEATPEISGDGLTIYFASDMMTTAGNFDVWMATRPSRADAWGMPVRVDELASGMDDRGANTPDGTHLVLSSNRSGNAELYISTHDATWSPPAELAELDSLQAEQNAFLLDVREIYFASDRGGNRDLYVAYRTSDDVRFSPPQPITELDSGNADDDPWVSPDGHHIFFASNRSGAMQVYEAER